MRVGDYFEPEEPIRTISLESESVDSIYALEAREPDLDLREFNKTAIAIALEQYSVPVNTWAQEGEQSWLASQASAVGSTAMDKVAAGAAAVGAVAGSMATKAAGYIWDKTKEYTIKGVTKASDAAKSAVSAGMDKVKEYSDKNNRGTLANQTRIKDLKDRISDKDEQPKTDDKIEVSDRNLLANNTVPRNANDYLKEIEKLKELGEYLVNGYSKEIDNIAETYIHVIENQEYATSFAAGTTAEKILEKLKSTGFIQPRIRMKEEAKERGQYKVFQSENLLGNRVFQYKEFDFDATEGMSAWEALNHYYDQSVGLVDPKITVRMSRWAVDMPKRSEIEALLDAMEALIKVNDDLNRNILKNTVPQYEEKIQKTYSGRSSAIGNILQKAVDKAAVNTIGTQSTKTVAKIMQTYPEWTVQVYSNYISNTNHVVASLAAWLNQVLKHY